MKLFLFVLCFHYCRADFCHYNFSIVDLQSSVIEEVISFINDGLFVCSNNEVYSSNINFWVYTRSCPLGRKLDSSYPQVRRTKTIVLIPGWLCNITNDLMPELKDAYLTRYDANVIIVDWSVYAARTYGMAYCFCPNVAAVIADFLLRLEMNLCIPIGSIHIVGHSLGAQMAGLIGQRLQRLYNRKLYRITGLDPAGPLFLRHNEDKRLDKSDANFVDIIHTNGGVLGYAKRCGHVDYYPGCRGSQNGCRFGSFDRLTIDVVIEKIACDHLRSVDYMIESIYDNSFRAEAKLFFCIGNSFSISYMGEYSIKNWADDNYILYTNPSPPFGKY